MSHNFEADGPQAYFARLNEVNAIDQIFAINREDMLDSEGVEQEALGIAICQQEFGGENWIRVSYQPEHLGGIVEYWHTYDAETNTLIPPAEPVIPEPVAEVTE